MSSVSEAVRAGMRRWASGVTVVATADGDRRAGSTASSFTSVSLEPPLVLVCLHQETNTYNLIKETGTFAVSILTAQQEHASSQMAGFAGVPEGEDKFYDLPLTTAETGAPLIVGAAAWMDCKVFADYDGGTHRIVLGEVVAAGVAEAETAPLLYFNQGYARLAP